MPTSDQNRFSLLWLPYWLLVKPSYIVKYFRDNATLHTTIVMAVFSALCILLSSTLFVLINTHYFNPEPYSKFTTVMFIFFFAFPIIVLPIGWSLYICLLLVIKYHYQKRFTNEELGFNPRQKVYSEDLGSIVLTAELGSFYILLVLAPLFFAFNFIDSVLYILFMLVACFIIFMLWCRLMGCILAAYDTNKNFSPLSGFVLATLPVVYLLTSFWHQIHK